MDQHAWTLAYRRRYQEADAWASGSSRIHHAVETQDRVFRMIEQLQTYRPFKDRACCYQVLKAADVLVDAVLSSEGRACRAVALVPAVGYLTAESLMGSGQKPRCIRRRGYEPIFFDAHDPAAFTWAVFEVDRRIKAATDRVPCRCHPVVQPQPCPVAI